MCTDPADLLLDRRDPGRNMARFYRLDIAPDLFGGAVLVRSWGRIGSRGQERRHWFATVAEAARAQDLWAGRKLRRGYLLCGR